jgi:hypothetical protein
MRVSKMFPRRTKNTPKQFRKDTLEEKWPEVREAEQPKTGRNTHRKRRNPQKQ